MTVPPFPGIRWVTFDCYGTLIDWETGILGALSAWLAGHGASATNREILDRYAQYEPEEQEGGYRTYRDVLSGVLARFAEDYGFRLRDDETFLLADSLKDWKPFPDTNAALNMLRKKYSLAVISNIDNDLFELTKAQMPPVFSHVVTAQEVGAYKPSHRNFQAALSRIGCRPEQMLHVAESLYHDVRPCNELGIRCVWVNRRTKAMDAGATRATEAVPDAIVSSLSDLADIIAAP